MAYYSVSKRNGKFCCQVRWYPEGDKKRRSANKTFSRRETAEAWGKKRVAEIESGDQGGAPILLGDLLDKYLNDRHVTLGRTKRHTLNMLRDCDIAKIAASALQPKDIVDFCKDRKDAGAGAATIALNISNLRTVLKSAEALYGVKADESAIIKAMPTLHALSLVGKSRIRSRRPTESEIEKLKIGLQKRQDKGVIPFVQILDFSVLSCMRIGEVCAILWEDFNAEEGWVMVRDRKDPRKKIGNHMRVPLLGGALEIVLAQPKTPDPRIFPFNRTSVTAGFQKVRDRLGIKDLRYHDLRREGASRLFEKGYAIDQVAQVTGHRDLNTLWRIYTDLNPKRLT